MLPNLNRLSLTRTGGSLAFAQWPESEICVLCLYPLTAPPPDGQNVWPFDNEEGITVVACWRQHAFHKGCLRAFVRDSDTTECPECRVPMIPEVLTHVSRPSSGEHAAREAREAVERAEGQQRDAEDARRREREMLEQMQREFQDMDAEDRRMHADAYGELTLTSSDEEEEDPEREAQAELDAMDEFPPFLEREPRQRNPPARMRPDSDQEDSDSEDYENWDAAVDIGLAMRLGNTISGGRPQGDRSFAAYTQLSAAIEKCIARGSHTSGTVEYRAAMIRVLTNRDPMYNTRGWFHNTIVVCADFICPPAVKGQLLRLLAAYAEDTEVQNQLYAMNAQQGGRASWDAAGAFAAAIHRYIAHLEQLGPMTNLVSGEIAFESNSKDSRLIDAKRVLHHLKWDALVRDEWLLPYNGRNIVDEDSRDFRLFSTGEGAQLLRNSDEAVSWLEAKLAATRGTYYHVTEPAVYADVNETLRALLTNFRVWHARYSAFDEYNLSDEHPVIPFPFGRVVVRLWAIANYMHRLVQNRQEDEGPPQGSYETEKDERYQSMTERLTRLVWLGVTWWIGRPYPANNDSATPDEMAHFFWAYVAPLYGEAEDIQEMYAIDREFEPTELVEKANDAMRDQWVGDRRTGPWFRNLGMDDAERAAERAERQAQRARDGGETPNPRRQRRD